MVVIQILDSVHNLRLRNPPSYRSNLTPSSEGTEKRRETTMVAPYNGSLLFLFHLNITIIIIRQELSLDGPVSASSNNLLKCFSSRLRPFVP